MNEIQTQKFYWLKYEISEIQQMINNSPGIDSFVLVYYFGITTNPGKPFQLISYAYMKQANQYSSYYNLLTSYNNNALELSGPLIMSNNMISLADMELLINTPDPTGDKPDYLVFIPNVNDTRHLYYDVKRYKRTDTGDVEFPGSPVVDPINTNPSPPATYQ